MLTLDPGSACDVCAEEFGPHKLPATIPCGHVLCATCCTTICEKTSIRLTPTCPFCRESFSHDSIRIIRIDMSRIPSSSGTCTPRTPFRSPLIEDADLPDDYPPPPPANGLGFTSAFRGPLVNTEVECQRARAEARRLEDKVAKVAAKKCSVEEVSTLHKELQAWLTSDSPDCKSDEKTSSLSLSAALLRAILMNHVAHSEASRVHKSVESALKDKLESAESARANIEAELRKQKVQYALKAQECQSLRAELNRLKTSSPPPPSSSHTIPPRPASTAPHTSPSHTHTRRQSTTSLPSTPISPPPSTSTHTSPTRYPTYTTSPPRSSTPSFLPARTSTPHLISLPSRSSTPGIFHSQSRSLALAARLESESQSRPPLPLPPSTSSSTSSSTSTSTLRPTSPPTPHPKPKQRTLSGSGTTLGAQKMLRSPSDERHERWIPSADPDSEFERDRERSRTRSPTGFGFASFGAGAGRFGGASPYGAGAGSAASSRTVLAATSGLR